MIRVPFFSASDDKPVVGEHQDRSISDANLAVERLDARLATLEQRLAVHAEELKINVSDRVTRIQCRLERALRPFQTERERNKREGETAPNIVEFNATANHGKEPINRTLYVQNAREAMAELNETLRLTRDHLESLSGSIERMRRSIPKR